MAMNGHDDDDDDHDDDDARTVRRRRPCQSPLDMGPGTPPGTHADNIFELRPAVATTRGAPEGQ